MNVIADYGQASLKRPDDLTTSSVLDVLNSCRLTIVNVICHTSNDVALYCLLVFLIFVMTVQVDLCVYLR